MMREPTLNRSTRGVQSGYAASSPAPIGGWNAKDPYAAMPIKDAIWLENWWPTTSEVTVRKGAKYHVTGITGQVRTLAAYSSPSSQKLFAFTSTAIYDVTNSGVVGASVYGPISLGDWRHVNFSVAGGSYLIAVNGADNLMLYNGTSWQNITNLTTPAITGLATALLDSVCVFKRRLWFVQKNSMSAWYLPVNQIGGALTEFPLGQLFNAGGKLLTIATWTVDAGNGADDYAVFITSEGEAAVYKGNDPASSTDWSLVGVYYIGQPVGKKSVFKFGGDLFIITQTGLYPLSKALLSATVNRDIAVSNKIDLIFSQSASVYGNYYGWEGVVFPMENMVLVNVPTIEGTQAKQLVMNTITGAWALFSNWKAICWETLGNKLFFGANGYVAQAMVGANDFGENIIAIAKTAFNYYNTKFNKHFKLIRPVIHSSSAVNVEVGADVDFASGDFDTSIVSFASPLDFVWDTAVWDSGIWGGDSSVRKEWRTIFTYPGFCASLRLRIASKDIIIGWSSTDILYQKGGVL